MMLVMDWMLALDINVDDGLDVGVGYNVGDRLGVGDGDGYDVRSGVVGAGGGIIIPPFQAS